MRSEWQPQPLESAPNRKREPEKFFDTAGPPLIKESIELQKAKDAQRSQELVNQLQKKTGSVGGTQKGNVEGKNSMNRISQSHS